MFIKVQWKEYIWKKVWIEERGKENEIKFQVCSACVRSEKLFKFICNKIVRRGGEIDHIDIGESTKCGATKWWSQVQTSPEGARITHWNWVGVSVCVCVCVWDKLEESRDRFKLDQTLHSIHIQLCHIELDNFPFKTIDMSRHILSITSLKLIYTLFFIGSWK